MPNITRQRHSASAARRQILALCGILGVFFAFNALATIKENRNDNIRMLIQGVIIFQPLMAGAWMALSVGPFVTRLPIMVASMTILVLAPACNNSAFAHIQRSESVAMVISEFGIFVASMLVFIGTGRLLQIQIAFGKCASDQPAAPFRFSLKYLLTVITLYAIVFALLSRLTFAEPRRSLILGPGF